MKNKIVVIAFMLLLIIDAACFSGCSNQKSGTDNKETSDKNITLEENLDKLPASDVSPPKETEEEEEGDMKLIIGGKEMPMVWEDNQSVEALKQLGDTEIQLSMYGGNEQVGPIGKTIPSDDVQTTTKAGDVVLYSSNQIVVFYGSNTWAYTRLGHIDMSEEEMTELLGNGDVTLKIEN